MPCNLLPNNSLLYEQRHLLAVVLEEFAIRKHMFSIICILNSQGFGHYCKHKWKAKYLRLILACALLPLVRYQT
jgi:hypothetical protein